MPEHVQCYLHNEEVYRSGENFIHIRKFGQFTDTVVCKDRLFICESHDHPFTKNGVLRTLIVATVADQKEFEKFKLDRMYNPKPEFPGITNVLKQLPSSDLAKIAKGEFDEPGDLGNLSEKD